jgi:ligand-binding sensor domain-containing protein
MAGIAVGVLFGGCRSILALNPSLDISQYAHTTWTVQDDALKGAIRSIAQTPDGYLWLGTEFGLVRFDGVRFVSWTPPSGQSLPSTNIQSLLAGRDGTLWIGTVEGLASRNHGLVHEYGEFAHQNVLTLLEDLEGRIWVGTFQVPRAKLCTIQHGKVDCYGSDGSLGQWVWSLYEGNLTAWSERSVGTEVDLRIPANTAYTATGTVSWLSRTFAAKDKA